MSTAVRSQGTQFTTTRDGGNAPNTVGGTATIENPNASQIHVWGSSARDETINISFANITGFTNGHHIRGEQKNLAYVDGNNDRVLSQDNFNFTNLNQISSGGTVVGRLEDFDPTYDKIHIGGTGTQNQIILSQGSGQIGGHSWKVVEHNGDHNGTENPDPQKWLVITTASGGHVVYALEGARVDGSPANGPGQVQEHHFITQTTALQIIAEPSVQYVDPQNYVPHGQTTNSGIVYNDYDNDQADVDEVIQHSPTLNLTGDDLIGGGINGDIINAHTGNDKVWGGSGHDTLSGGDGNDTMYGGTGNDELKGNNGDDILYGGSGNDTLRGYNDDDRLYGGDGQDLLYGYSGNDTLYGNGGNDVMNGHAGNDLLYGGHGDDRFYGSSGNDFLSGGSGNDKLFGGSESDTLTGGSGNDLIAGEAGQDFVAGNAGNDTFVFKDGHLINWSQTSGSVAQRSQQLDLIEDFTIGQDKILFDNVSSVDDMSDLRAWQTTIDGNLFYTVKVHATNERILVDVDDNTTWAEFFNASNFDFA